MGIGLRRVFGHGAWTCTEPLIRVEIEAQGQDVALYYKIGLYFFVAHFFLMPF